MLPDEWRLWEPYDGCVEEKEMKWRTTVHYFFGLKPVIYLSKKEALNTARRQMQKEEQEGEERRRSDCRGTEHKSRIIEAHKRGEDDAMPLVGAKSPAFVVVSKSAW